MNGPAPRCGEAAPVLWYVHDHGTGHLARARAVIPHLRHGTVVAAGPAVADVADGDFDVPGDRAAGRRAGDTRAERSDRGTTPRPATPCGIAPWPSSMSSLPTAAGSPSSTCRWRSRCWRDCAGCES